MITPGEKSIVITNKVNTKDNNIYSFLIYIFNRGFYVFLEGSSIRVIPSGLSLELKQAIQGKKLEIISFLEEKKKDSILSPEVNSTALWLIGLLRDNDQDKASLISRLRKASYFNATEDDLMSLSLALVEVYARKVNPSYRATIWGGRTWEECYNPRRQ